MIENDQIGPNKTKCTEVDQIVHNELNRTKVDLIGPNMLTSEFQGIEVFQALKQMYPTKAPGPDGMPPLFFQHFW